MSDDKKINEDEMKQAAGGTSQADAMRPASGSEVPDERPVLSVDDLQRASGGLDGVAATPKPQTEPLDQSDLQRASGAAHSASTTDGLPSAGGSFRPTFEGDIVDGDEPRDISPI